ncbi:MAG: hypothetical protein COB43_09415 [Oceanospirillales bacterium]|nr:MAG: hypothetical protein COB43_09415 [Oceanospirillales bacterium]
MFKKVLIFVMTTLAPLLAYGETGYKKGTIEYIRVHDESIASWEPPVFWFTLNGVTSAGSCPAWNGNVLFVATSQYTYSLIMAAYMAGKEMALGYDDTYKHASSYCIVKHVTAGDPPPTF